MSVLLTVNIVSHNPAQSSSDNIPLNLQTITITWMLFIGQLYENSVIMYAYVCYTLQLVSIKNCLTIR